MIRDAALPTAAELAQASKTKIRIVSNGTPRAALFDSSFSIGPERSTRIASPTSTRSGLLGATRSTAHRAARPQKATNRTNVPHRRQRRTKTSWHGFRIVSFPYGKRVCKNVFDKQVTNGLTAMGIQWGSVAVLAATTSTDNATSRDVRGRLALLKAALRHLTTVEATSPVKTLHP